MTPMDAQYWETETRKQEKWAEVQQVEMWTVMGYHNHSSGMHSAQRMFGCEIQEDGRYRGFWQFGYDGQDHLSLDLETLSWVSAEPVAMRTKHWWETERCYAEYDKAYLEGPCLASLHRYLELGGQRFSRREPPTVRITEHSAKDGGTILRCWALGFYPHNILLSWWLGEKELDSEYAETRPSGDGTYQTWAAAWVPAGKKAQYTCRVQHSSLNHTFTVSWGEELGLGPERVRRGWGGPRAPGDSPMDWGWGGPFSLSSLRVLSSWTYCHGYLPRPGLAGGGWWCDLDQVHSSQE
ncbi:H-2 class I histocompatibility antigen, alpha chain-like isoform X4 [Phocoena sinus]|uniref:H-2 class I histocompatibility antigen, alpha chain-like isoform X4 n=1 Tax=Phocoena sinus TaxID=42100 RepID=UPI0013C45035|nr:H-2 class I histocompatibility antigen, alpha chain-like isoform X4 [Phocoena sinus]